MIWIPTLEQIFALHSKLIARTGGSDGFRDAGLIESALMRAKAAFGGVEAYRTVSRKAAAICCGLIGNHGFIDGNKRIGIAAMLLVLRRNDITLRYAQAELICLGLNAAQGIVDVNGVAEWIEQHMA